MLFVLSPSKTLDETSALPKLAVTQPELLADTETLLKKLQTLNEKKLAALMDISPKLAALNMERYRHFEEATPRPALFTFKGDVYAGMPVQEYTKRELDYAQSHLRILSGLYGVLRPLDMIRPYRLEMGTSLAVGKHKHLYVFWGDRIAKSLNRAAQDSTATVLINLASEEYAAAIQRQALNIPVIDIIFKEKKGNTLKTIGLLAKRARGRMAHYAIEQTLTKPERLKDFTDGGYAFTPSLSNDTQWVFVRG